MIGEIISKFVVEQAIKTGSKGIENAYTKAGDSLFRDQNKIKSKFSDELYDAISNLATESTREEYINIIAQWDLVEANIDNLESYKMGSEELIFENEEGIIDGVSIALAEIVEVNLEKNPEIKEELTSAVEKAFYSTFDYLEEKSREKQIDGEMSEYELQLANQVKEIKRSISQIERRHSWSNSFNVYTLNNRTLDQIVTTIAERLGVDLNVPYIERGNFDRISDENKIVIKGREGSGKSREVIEISRKIIESNDIKNVIVPTNDVLDLDDVRELCSTHFHGHTLLIWDDIHKSYSLNRGTNIFSATITQLEEEMKSEGLEMFLVGSLRSDEIDEIQSYKKPDSIWNDSIREVVLEQLDPDDINNLITEMSERFEIKISNEARRKLGIKVIKSDPFPFYIYSVISSAQEEGKLSEERIESYSDSAREFWKDHFQNLADTDNRSKHILWSLDILDTLSLSYYKSLIRGIYHEVFDQPKFDFDDDLKSLESKGWIQVVDSDLHRNSVVQIHDLQIEAIAMGDNKNTLEACIQEFSEFLLHNLEPYLPDYNEWVEPILQQNFAAVTLELDESSFRAEVEEHLLRSISSDHEIPAAHGNYGSFLSSEGKTTEAAEYFEKAIDENQHSPILRAQYARFLEDRGEEEDMENAERQFKLAVQSNPPNPKIYKYYGQFLMRRGKTT